MSFWDDITNSVQAPIQLVQSFGSDLLAREENGAAIVAQAYQDNTPPIVQWFVDPTDWGPAPNPFNIATPLPSLSQIIAQPSQILATAPNSSAAAFETSVAAIPGQVAGAGNNILLIGGLAIIVFAVIGDMK